MNRVSYFEFSAQDPERSATFYRDAFGWEIKKWEGPADYWVVTTGPNDQPGINGGIVGNKESGARTVNIIDVPSLDEAIAKVRAAGGEVVVPAISIPGVGYRAFCADTEGMIFGVYQADPSAQ